MLSLAKLKQFVQGNPNYTLRYIEGYLELEFAAPPLSEAAEQDVEGEAAFVIVKFQIDGDYLTATEAWVEQGDHRRPMDVGQLEPWLEYIESQP
jgi:hypothetical protein